MNTGGASHCDHVPKPHKTPPPGPVQVPTVVDYKDVLLTLVPEAPRTQHLCGFLCELSLLHTSLAAYAPACLAAAALLLARLTHGQSKEPALLSALQQEPSQGLGIPEGGTRFSQWRGRTGIAHLSWRRHENGLKAILWGCN